MATVKRVVASSRQKIKNRVVLLHVQRAISKNAEVEAKSVQADLIALMDSAGTGAMEVEHEGLILDAKVMRNSSIVIDEVALRDRIGEELWDKITTQTMDKKKLEAFVGSGEISATLVAQCATEKPIAPFIRIDKRGA